MSIHGHHIVRINKDSTSSITYDFPSIETSGFLIADPYYITSLYNLGYSYDPYGWICVETELDDICVLEIHGRE